MPRLAFLIIGAMKAGTTTLFMDLARHPGLFLSEDEKEPHYLGFEEPVTTLIDRYRELFSAAHDGQLCGEASTGYSKRPLMEGVAERALAVAGPELRVIYLVRDPIERLLSQYRHETTAGELDMPLSEAIEHHAPLTQYSLYGYQVEPWVRCFGADQVRVVRFEDYVQDRAGISAKLAEWLGAAPQPVDIDTARVYNQSDKKPVVSEFWHTIRSSLFYRNQLRPLLPMDMRLRLMRMVLPRAAAPLTDLDPALAEALVERFSPDQQRLAELMGWDEPLYQTKQMRVFHGVSATPSHA